MKKIFNFFSDILVRFYMEIVAGVWGVIVMMPLDSYLYTKYTGSPTYTIDRNFWIFFTSYTIFFIASGALIPVIRRKQISDILNNLILTKQITISQKNHIISVVKDTQCCLSIFSKNGFLQFFMKNIFSLGVMFAYFAIEGLIVNTMNGVTYAVPLIFLALFGILLLIESLIDRYVAYNMKNSNTANKFSDLDEYGASQKLMTYLIDGVRGSNLSDKVSQVVYEETVEDIAQIMTISTEKKETKLVKKGSKILPKGRLEKAKHGIISNKIKKKGTEMTKKMKNNKKKNKIKNKTKNKNRKQKRRLKKNK